MAFPDAAVVEQLRQVAAEMLAAIDVSPSEATRVLNQASAALQETALPFLKEIPARDWAFMAAGAVVWTLVRKLAGWILLGVVVALLATHIPVGLRG